MRIPMSRGEGGGRRRRKRANISLFLLLLNPSLQLASCSSGPAVNVGLKASWNGAPFLLELLETAATENKASYFPLLDRIASGDFDSPPLPTDKALYDEFLRVAQKEGFLTDTEELASFNFALSIHSAAPRIEAHYHYYETALEPLMGKLYDPGCRVWLQWNSKQVCKTTGGLKNILETEFAGGRYPNEQRILQFDRVREIAVADGGGGGRPAAAIIYGDVQTEEFKEFHAMLKPYVDQGQITYRVRYRPPPLDERKERPVILSGYGVELVLKKTDYMVMDDRDVQAAAGDTSNPANNDNDDESVKQKDSSDTSQAPLAAAAGTFENEEIQDIKPLHPKDIALLGIKAASFVLKSKDPFNTLLRLIQDFPKHSSAIASSEIDPEVSDGLLENWNIIAGGAGVNALWINGLQIDDSQINAFALLESLRRERGYINGIKALGLDSIEAVGLLSHKMLADARQDEQTQRFDYRDAIEGGDVILWLNDLEKDKRYQEWSPMVATLLRRIYPGQLHSLRKNIHHLVVPIDFSAKDDLILIAEQLRIFVQRKIPIRFGLVPLTKTSDAVVQAKVFYYLVDAYGLSTALRYLDEVISKGHFSKPDKKLFNSFISESTLRKEKEALSLDEIFASKEFEEKIKKAKSWGVRMGTTHSPVPPVFINGIALPKDDNWMQQMSARLQADVGLAQRAVYEEIVNDKSDFAIILLFGAATRRNPHIFPENDAVFKLINVAELSQRHADIFQRLPSIPTDQTDKLFEAELWVVGDFDEKDGYKLLQRASEIQKSVPGVNLVLINNPQLMSQDPALSTLLYQLQQGGFFSSPDRLEKLLEEAPPTKESVDLPDFETFLYKNQPDVKVESWQFPDHIVSGKSWAECRGLLSEVGFKPGQRGLVLNGRIIGPIPIEDEFSVEDFKQLLDYEKSKRIEPVLEAANDLGALHKLTGTYASARLTNIIALTTISEVLPGIFDSPHLARTDVFNKPWDGKHSTITRGDKNKATIQITASINPASEIAQKLVPILNVLSELDGVYLRIFLNPEKLVQELPIKRFYRHVLNSAPSFDETGSLIHPRARFEALPEEPLLSLSMDVPPSWLVNPKECIYDPDNIKLDSLKDRLGASDFEALYELRSILIEGHSRDVTVGGPPRGAQLVLGTEKDPHFADTIVMANLGYFQFKANPGFWKMGLKHGRSAEIYHIDSAGTKGESGQEGDENPEITLMSFQGATLFPRLSRKPGMEGEDVLEAPSSSSSSSKSAWDLVNKWVKKAEGLLENIGLVEPTQGVKPQAEINIFSVASGHLYERFLNIMMLSVMKHTDKTVKFWFIENFLSPSFKGFIPVMAKEYGFDYELVTYKWPHWLRSQKEKQREIWGYKILFLDVLFPLDLDKVIFVDADQIVRTDLKELVDLDLQGAPYGFTPMCDSREEIEGFRFWKQGYWKTFLRGLPYHISALYVVDLKLFRQIAAGDRLRQQYHSLSADPNSLANLDQDLPNHMQAMLPIYSLPQDWLWCETWCSDESLKTAKTIDLCNNPMTKEPKLDRAKRQVPEWTAYDEEIAGLARRSLKKEGDIVGHLSDVLKKESTSSFVVEVPARNEL